MGVGVGGGPQGEGWEAVRLAAYMHTLNNLVFISSLGVASWVRMRVKCANRRADDRYHTLKCLGKFVHFIFLTCMDARTLQNDRPVSDRLILPSGKGPADL